MTAPRISPAAATDTLAVDGAENEALVVIATKGTASTQYWLRCLPHDFPQIALVAHADAGASPPPGYYLVGNFQTDVSGGYAMVLNTLGVPVWYSALPTGIGAVDVDKLGPGVISLDGNPSVYLSPFQLHALDPPKFQRGEAVDALQT